MEFVGHAIVNHRHFFGVDVGEEMQQIAACVFAHADYLPAAADGAMVQLDTYPFGQPHVRDAALVNEIVNSGDIQRLGVAAGAVI